MIYLIDKKTDKVRMVSDTPIKYDTDKFYVKDIDDREYDGYEIKYKDGKLDKDKIEDKGEKKQRMKNRLNDATTIEELKDIIKELI